MSGDYHWVCMYLLCATQIQKQHHSFILPTEPEKSRFTATEKSRMPVKWWNCTETSGITKQKRFAVFKLRKATVQIDTTEKDLECALSELRKSEDSLQEAIDSKKNVNPCCEGVWGGGCGMNIFWYRTIWWYFYSSLVLMWLHASFRLPCRDYCQKLALALTSNPKTTLNSLSLNGNSIEDRGID